MVRVRKMISFGDRRLAEFLVLDEENPNLAATAAPTPEIIATPTANNWDSDDTDPMTSSGEGMAHAGELMDHKNDTVIMSWSEVAENAASLKNLFTGNPEQVCKVCVDFLTVV